MDGLLVLVPGHARPAPQLDRHRDEVADGAARVFEDAFYFETHLDALSVFQVIRRLIKCYYV